jgi:serine/threonine protein kinase
LKTYFTSEDEQYHENEVSAYRHLGNRATSSIINFHGSFSRGHNYNLILEYADKGSLGAYFKTESPPSEGEEIIRFWESMFKLLIALQHLHELSLDDTDGLRVFNRYVKLAQYIYKSFDIKNSNIRNN